MTTDNQYWLSLTEDQVKDTAKLWSKKFTTKRLETFIDWYRKINRNLFLTLSEAERQGKIETDNCKEMAAIHNRERVALIARFMRENPKESVPDYL